MTRQTGVYDASTTPEGKAPAPLYMIPTAPDSSRVLEAEAAARRRKQRRAEYDKQNPIIGFFVPAHMIERAKMVKASMAALAYERVSTETSVSLAMINWALLQVRNGKLDVDSRPAPKRRKMNVVIVEQGGDTWLTPQEIPQLLKEQEKAKGGYVGWRWTEDVKRQLDGLSSDVLPVGELTIKLLEYAVSAYRQGKIKIQTEALEVKQDVQVKQEKW